jgi:hypothetical protein
MIVLPDRTRIWSAQRIVESRCAITSEVPALKRDLHRFLDSRLRGHIKMGGGLIKHYHGRSLEQQPGYRQPLPLTAGQTVPAITDNRVKAIGQRPDEVVDPRRLAGLKELGLAGPWPGVLKVPPNGVVKEPRVLGHHSPVSGYPGRPWAGTHRWPAPCVLARSRSVSGW